jgi:putative protease
MKSLDRTALDDGLFLPVAELKALRRELVAELRSQVERGPARSIAAEEAVKDLLAEVRSHERPAQQENALLIPLCRQDEQLEAVIEAGLTEVELDWMELVGLERATTRAKEAGLRVHLATLRIEKPLEDSYLKRIERLEPDGFLVRHWGALMAGRGYGSRGRAIHGDFSLNVTNSLTAERLLSLGLQTVTPSHDLDEPQLHALLRHLDPARVTLVAHHRVPTFHNEHCLYAHLLSDGTDYRTCGRPCDHHQVSLRDHLSQEHPVVVDASCRNTVFNHEAQTLAPWIPGLLAQGVRRFRVEFVREDRATARTVLDTYGQVIAGALSPAELQHRLRVRAQQGVSSGAMELSV